MHQTWSKMKSFSLMIKSPAPKSTPHALAKESLVVADQ